MDAQHLSDGILEILNKMPSERSFWTKILSTIDEPLFIVNADKEIVFFNKKAEEVTGFSQEEVIGKLCLSGVRCVNCLIGCALFDEGRVTDRNLEFSTRDGAVIQVVKNGVAFTDAEGNIIGGVETFRDITREEEHKHQLAREKETVERVLNNIGDGVLELDAECTITFANSRIESMCGYSATELVGRKIEFLLENPHCGSLNDPAVSEGITTTLRTAEGNHMAVELTALPLMHDREHSGGGTILLFRRITPSERVSNQLREGHSYRGIISNSPAMIDIFNMVESIAESDVTILIDGESGTGKEMLARAIHEASNRHDKPFAVVNCAVFNENLLESELFGHCKGAFTGAVSDKIGRFELADGGTLFLDEIGELPSNLQVKLLRFLQNREFERVGELRTRKVDVRIIAATNRNLLSRIETGEFRDDLYYRLNVIPITLPPLRERPEDIPLLTNYFIASFCERKRVPTVPISDDAMLVLRRHDWSGNVRELENAVLHAITRCDGKRITVADLPHNVRVAKRPPATSAASGPATVEEAEKATILDALRENGFNRSEAAAQLGITRTTLWRKMKRYGLQ